MASDAAEMRWGSASGEPPKRRRRAPVIARIDRRTRIARRIAAITSALLSWMGGDEAMTPLQRTDIRRAAELTALAEDARARALRAAQPDLAVVVKLEGAADRAVRRLKCNPPEEHATFAERLAHELAESAGAVSSEPGVLEPGDAGERAGEAPATFSGTVR